MGNIILIGGAPAVGKTYLAEQLSLKLGIPWISADNIHSLMLEPVIPRMHTSRVIDSVRKFDSEGKTPTVDKRKITIQDILDKHIRENEDVWKDVLLFIKKNDLWESYIVEGGAIMPHVIGRDLKNRTDVHPLFLLDKSEDRIRKVLHMKTIWHQDVEYYNKAKNLDLNTVLYINRWLRSELKKYSYPYLELTEESIPISSVIKLIA
jgi:2-phosphoglycerate kinase